LTHAKAVGKLFKPQGSYIEPGTSDWNWSQQMAIEQSHSYELRNSPVPSALLFFGGKPVEPLGDHRLDSIMPFETNFKTVWVQL
jgi:hypothetical protein